MNYEFHRSWNLISIEILPFKFYWLSVLKCTNFPEFVFIVKIILTVKSLLINISLFVFGAKYFYFDFGNI